MIIENDDELMNDLTGFDIIDLIEDIKEKKNIKSLEDLSDEVLLFKDHTGNTVLDYLIENNYIENKRFQSGKIFEINNIDKALIYYKHQYDDILVNGINKDLLFFDYSNGETLLENIIKNKRNEKKFILVHLTDNAKALDIVLKYDRWDLVDLFDVSLLINKQFEKLNCLEALFEKNIISEYILSGIFNKNSDLDYCVDLCLKYDRNDILQNISSKHYCHHMKTGKTIIEYFFENNIANSAIVRNYIIDNDDKKFIVDLCVKYNKLEYLSLVDVETLLYKMDNGKTVLENLIDKDASIDKIYEAISGRFKKNEDESVHNKNALEVISILVRNNKFDELKNVNYRYLFEKIDSDKVLLDFLLEQFTKDNSFDLDNVISYIDLSEYRANIYIMFAKYDLEKLLPPLKKEQLLSSGYNHKTVLEDLLSIDSKLAYKVIHNKDKKDIEIAVLLKKYGIDAESLEITLEKDEFSKKYLIEKQSISSDISDESFELLKEFKMVMSDGKSDNSLIFQLINGYKYLLSSNNPYGKRDLESLIQIKKDHPEFALLKSDDGSYFLPGRKQVYLERPSIATLHHELGHAMYHIYNDFGIPNEFNDIVDRLSSNKDVLENSVRYAEIFSDEFKKSKTKAFKIFETRYNELFNFFKRMQIGIMLEKNKKELREELLGKGYPKDIVDYILTKEYTIKEFKKHYVNVNSEELIQSMFESEFALPAAICDILDAIFEGKICDKKLEGFESKDIRACGHGISYFRNNYESRFDEMIADYAEILKSKDSQRGVYLLTQIVGPELVNLLQDFYDNNMTLSSKKTL